MIIQRRMQAQITREQTLTKQCSERVKVLTHLQGCCLLDCEQHQSCVKSYLVGLRLSHYLRLRLERLDKLLFRIQLVKIG